MKARKISFLVLLMVLLTTAVFAADVAGDYKVRTNTTTGNWGAQIWQKCSVSGDPGTWSDVTTSPTSADGVITIQSGKTVTIAANVSVDQVVALGDISISTSKTLTVVGTGTNLSVSGSLNVSGTLSVSSGSDVTINNAGSVVFIGNATGSGSFTLASGATLTTRSADGITSSGSTGSVRTTTRSFSSGANYIFDSNTATQSTGDGLPSSVRNLTIANSVGVVLSQAVTVSNSLIFSGSGTLYLDTFDLTMGSSATTSGYTSFRYSDSGKLVNLNTVDFLAVTPQIPISFPTTIEEILLEDDVTAPNDFTVTTTSFNGSHLYLNNKVMTLANKSFALSGGAEVHTIDVSLTSTSNTWESGTSIARTWTTFADFVNPITMNLSYPQTETSAASVKVWRRATGDTGPWSYIGTYSTTGTTTRTVSVTGLTDLGIDGATMDWTISNTDQTLPVELSSFTATAVSSGFVRMDWITQSETGVQGFYIYRNTIENIASAEMVSPLISATNTSVETAYSFTDREVPGDGTYYYWLQNQEINGSSEFLGATMAIVQTGDNDTPDAPLGTRLNAPYPNPFNPSLTVSFDMAKADNVKIYIYNTKGQLIRTLLDAAKNTGYHRIVWDGKTDSGVAVTTGMYYVKMVSDKYKATHKVMMMK